MPYEDHELEAILPKQIPHAFDVDIFWMALFMHTPRESVTPPNGRCGELMHYARRPVTHNNRYIDLLPYWLIYRPSIHGAPRRCKRGLVWRPLLGADGGLFLDVGQFSAGVNVHSLEPWQSAYRRSIWFIPRGQLARLCFLLS